MVELLLSLFEFLTAIPTTNNMTQEKDFLYLTEIFYSIQGESNDAGYPCVFVRLSGCDLRCSWCDTEYSFTKGKRYSFHEILSEVEAYGVSRVEITGGEPLLQLQVIELMKVLLEKGHRVLIETGGHRDVANIPAEVVKVLDVKCPSSGESDHMRWENFQHLQSHDVVKFVIASKEDYDYACQILKEHQLPLDQVHFSVVKTAVDPHQVAQWMLDDRVEVKFQLQLHKLIDVP